MSGGIQPRAPYGATEEHGVITMRLYDEPSCRRVIEGALAAGAWEQAHVGGGEEESPVVRSEYRSAETFFPPRSWPPSREFDRLVMSTAAPLVRRAWRADIRRTSDTHVVRYPPGGFYLPHSDGVGGKDYRYFTVLCYLNEGFEGGRTCFPGLNLSVRPRAGKAILFPSTYLHCAEPVAAGEKYVIVTWLTGPPPIKWL